MNILFTAFKGVYNTSFQLIVKINRSSLLLTNSFSGLENEINFNTYDYDAIYMFGVDKNLNGQIRIENVQNTKTIFFIPILM